MATTSRVSFRETTNAKCAVFLWQHFIRTYWSLAFLLVTCVTIQALAFVMPYIEGLLIDMATHASEMRAASNWAIVPPVHVFTFIGGYALMWLVVHTVLPFGADMADSIFRRDVRPKVIHALSCEVARNAEPLKALIEAQKLAPGELHARSYGAEKILEDFVCQNVRRLPHLCIGVTSFFCLWYWSWISGGLITVYLCGAVYGWRLAEKRARPLVKRRDKLDSRLKGEQSEIFASALDDDRERGALVQAFLLYRKNLKRYVRVGFRSELAYYTLNASRGTLFAFIKAAVWLTGFWYLWMGYYSFPLFLMTLAWTLRVQEVVELCSDIAQQWHAAVSAYVLYNELVTASGEEESIPDVAVGTRHIVKVGYRIEAEPPASANDNLAKAA